MAEPIDFAAIKWLPWPAHTPWACAEAWLSNFGMDLGAERPDAGAVIDSERYAYRLDSAGKSIALIVTVDYDAAGDSEGWTDLSRALSLEIVRLP